MATVPKYGKGMKLYEDLGWKEAIRKQSETFGKTTVAECCGR